MKMKLSTLPAAAVLMAAALAWQSAAAQDVTVVGPVTKIELASDGASAVATLKDGKSGTDVQLKITDDLTLDKFKDKRIVEGDEIRARFEKKDGQNASKSFKKTAGC
jgi:hypothetical protein